jgi:fido (protein-threonine AMPylation protein)
MGTAPRSVFDPFGTFDNKGYLENTTAEKDLEKVKRMEHLAFSSRLDQALQILADTKEITYATVLKTHKTLFQDFYHWAGRDRLSTAPDKEISKGDINSPLRTEFERPGQIQLAFDYGLQLSSDQKRMKAKAGTVMGLFAFAHPFLDGNGRTILLVHMELCFRAGFSIAWAATQKQAYLEALSREIDSPYEGFLDTYLQPFIRPVTDREDWMDQILNIRGLEGASAADAMDDGVYVAGKVDDPEMTERYRAQAGKRRYRVEPDL